MSDEAINGMVETINELERELEKYKWIPCSERLPNKERETYWVCTDTKYQCECRWTNNVYGLRESDRWGWSKMDYPQFSKVIAWMPLPRPYEETDHE